MLKLSQSLQPTLWENVNLVQVIRRKGKAGLIREYVSMRVAYFMLPKYICAALPGHAHVWASFAVWTGHIQIVWGKKYICQ